MFVFFNYAITILHRVTKNFLYRTLTKSQQTFLCHKIIIHLFVEPQNITNNSVVELRVK